MRTQVHIKEKEFEAAVARANVTYKELAKRLGINRIYLSNIKNPDLPEFRPSGKLRKKLMQELGVTFDTIFEVRQNGRPIPAPEAKPPSGSSVKRRKFVRRPDRRAPAK